MRQTTVGEIAAKFPRSIAIGPFGSALRAERYTSTGVPVVRGQNVGERWGLSTEDVVYVSRETADEFPSCIVKPGDLVFPHRGAIGRVARVDDGQWLLSSSMMKLTVDPTIADSRFVLLYFRDEGRNQLLSRASTVGTPGIGQPLTSLRSIPISLPPLAEQQAIAEVLGALDDKIAANNSVASASDNLLRTEFANLDQSHQVRIGTVAESPRDAADPRALDPLTTYVGLEHIPRRSVWIGESGVASDVTSGKSWFRPGDTLFGKLRPYFHKVCSASCRGVCSTDVLVIRASDPSMATVLLAALSSDDVVASVTASSGGTKMPRTSWNDIAALSVPWPTSDEGPRLAGRLDDVRSAILALFDENRTLAATRDALLPQLMSGKLRVRDAENAVAEAGA